MMLIGILVMLLAVLVACETPQQQKTVVVQEPTNTVAEVADEAPSEPVVNEIQQEYRDLQTAQDDFDAIEDALDALSE